MGAYDVWNTPRIRVADMDNGLGLRNTWTDDQATSLDNYGKVLGMHMANHFSNIRAPKTADVVYDINQDQHYIFSSQYNKTPISRETAGKILAMLGSMPESLPEHVRLSILSKAMNMEGEMTTRRSPLQKIESRMRDLDMAPTRGSMAREMYAFETEKNKGVFVITLDGDAVMIKDENPSLFPSDGFMTQLRILFNMK